jgi:hypothetical protein
MWLPKMFVQNQPMSRRPLYYYSWGKQECSTNTMFATASGSIVVYSSFESQRLSDLAVWLPEYAERINAIQTRLFDLLPVVREHTYHPAYAGSYSIKSVLPALVPEMTYDGMEIANGQDAGLSWASLVRGDLNSDEREWIEKALLDYCGLDTLAMIRLVETLQRGAVQ